MNAKGDILIVDDQPNALKVLSAILSEEGYAVMQSSDVDNATELIHTMPVDAVITDIMMPGKDGMQFFDYINSNHPGIPVIFLTAYGTVESAVSAMTRGAFHYFMKPPNYQNLKSIVAKAVERRAVSRNAESRNPAGRADRLSHIIGRTPEMQRLFETIDAVKCSSTNIHICGETGTGKELVAREVHDNGQAAGKPFVAVNCAAIPRELIEVELFGCEKGAFTGAVARRTGKFEEAGDGVIFLDEIGELDHSMQAKLLRVLQEREIERLGCNRKIKVAFRLISATNCDLAEEVKKGRFREDLYYRINVIEIKVPPLRDRRDDIPLLAEAFLREFCAREHKKLAFTGDVIEALREYPWPGNIRQLRNVIERAVVLNNSGSITLKDLPGDFHLSRQIPETVVSSGKTLREVEMQAIRQALLTSNGNKSKAAKLLKISRKALYKRLDDEMHLNKADHPDVIEAAIDTVSKRNMCF
ncbi:MAG: sigma-54-dependent Fis family transcriptional regulator [Thermodesulfovibrio sp.]|nr:sigma-54-dependent Fis family transcriptional regulator [Thermodesulfovibrio sp.]